MNLAKRTGVRRIRLCQCMFGLRFPGSKCLCQKDTTILTNVPLEVLNVMCDKSHTHEHAIGAIKVNGEWLKRSELAGHYPKALCQAWADAATFAVPYTL